MIFYTLREAARILQGYGFVYHRKTVVDRTIVTMADNGLFESLKYCECGKCRMVSESEINRMLNLSS
jgi:hypothetical protein